MSVYFIVLIKNLQKSEIKKNITFGIIRVFIYCFQYQNENFNERNDISYTVVVYSKNVW